MHSLLRIAAALLVTLAFSSDTIQAAEICGPHETLADRLTKQFKESRRAAGLSQQAELIEVYASADGSWTIVVTNAAGYSCVVVNGEAWQPDRSFLAGIDS